MPEYFYKCPSCKHSKEIFHAIRECDAPSLETMIEITCPKHGIMKRVPQETLLNGATGKTERQMLKEKQKLVSKRAQLHTKNEGWKEIKNPEYQKRIHDKYHGKNSKFKDIKGDHDKIKY